MRVLALICASLNTGLAADVAEDDAVARHGNELAKLTRVFRDDPNKMCTVDLANISGFSGITNMAAFCLSTEIDLLFVLGGLKSMLKWPDIDPNKLLTLQQKGRITYHTDRRLTYPRPWTECSVFALICKPITSNFKREAYLIARTLFESESFDLNGVAWRNGTESYETVLEMTLMNIKHWEVRYARFDLFRQVFDHDSWHAEKNYMLYAYATLAALATEHQKRLAALKEHYRLKKVAVAMLSVVADDGFCFNIQTAIRNTLKNFILTAKPPEPMVLNSTHLTRVMNIVERSDLLKVNPYLKMIIPQEHHEHAAFEIEGERKATMLTIDKIIQKKMMQVTSN